MNNKDAVHVQIRRCIKLAFHDADTDTDTDTDIFVDILARIVARMAACRSACHTNNFGKSRVSDVSARILARMSVSVSVSASASWNPYLRAGSVPADVLGPNVFENGDDVGGAAFRRLVPVRDRTARQRCFQQTEHCSTHTQTDTCTGELRLASLWGRQIEYQP